MDCQVKEPRYSYRNLAERTLTVRVTNTLAICRRCLAHQGCLRLRRQPRHMALNLTLGLQAHHHHLILRDRQQCCQRQLQPDKDRYLVVRRSRLLSQISYYNGFHRRWARGRHHLAGRSCYHQVVNRLRQVQQARR